MKKEKKFVIYTMVFQKNITELIIFNLSMQSCKSNIKRVVHPLNLLKTMFFGVITIVH